MLKKSILWCIFGNFSHPLSEQRQPVFTKHLHKGFIAPNVKRFMKNLQVVYFCRECSLIRKIKTDNTTFWVLLFKTVEVLMQSKKSEFLLSTTLWLRHKLLMLHHPAEFGASIQNCLCWFGYKWKRESHVMSLFLSAALLFKVGLYPRVYFSSILHKNDIFRLSFLY